MSNLENLKNVNIIFKCIAGSKMYGTNTPESDTDIRGIFIPKKSDLLTIKNEIDEISDTKNDIKYFSLKKFITLAMKNNPNILELLNVPNDCILKTTKEYDIIKENIHKFFNKRVYYSYYNYAKEQIKKAKCKNKKVYNTSKYFNEKLNNLNMKYIFNVNDENVKQSRINDIIQNYSKNYLKYLYKIKDKTDYNQEVDVIEEIALHEKSFDYMKPTQEQFCYIITNLYTNQEHIPFRLNRCNINLNAFDCSSVEHMHNTYRLYKNGSGLFKNGNIIFKSISKDRELNDFYGILVFNKDEYNVALREYNSFWEWMVNRSEERYNKCWNKDYDCKNIMHCVRLLLECEHILNNNIPKVRMDKNTTKYLLNIRNGKYEYDEIINIVNNKMNDIENLFKQNKLPDDCDINDINDIYLKIINSYYKLKI